MNNEVDYNLLGVLPLLYQHRKLKPVAKALGKTESAVSKQLTKLREQLGDPLFVRGKSHYEPTEWLEANLHRIAEGVSLLDSVTSFQSFDPKEYDKWVVISMPSIAYYFKGKAVLFELMKRLPKAKIKLAAWSPSTDQDIVNGKIDMAINYFDPSLDQRVHQLHLGKFRPSLITSQRNSHLDAFERLKLPMVTLTVLGWSEDTERVRYRMIDAGYEPNIIATVENFTLLKELHQELDCVTYVPFTLNSISGISATVLPDELGADFSPSIVVKYKKEFHGSPLHQLLYEVIDRQLSVKHRSTAQRYSLTL
ncbi:LysR family transcriptional regulator [Vibrio sonorensis]|uniref:LysR family transcriptional regulator n=1 Tax=Vibrio sonorensis TaxID=1004316 RepID=UPI0008D9E955|nr:LysR family transcriptional regulator [Vibrio sonorensis]